MCAASRRRAILLLILNFSVACCNHYRSLGVARGADADAIKTAYRKIALKHHPDRISRSASPETRKKSQRTFELANDAFEVLGDPAQRRQYDFELDNPIQEGKDGIHRQGQQGMPRRPRVEVQVACELEALAGFIPVPVPLSAWSNALGASVTPAIAERLGLPRELYLPPGSVNGDSVRYVARSLGPQGCDIDFVLVAKQHRKWRRKGGTLLTTHKLPIWHNVLAPAVRLRGVDGEMVVVRERGERVGDGKGGGGKGGGLASTTTIPGRGMPLKPSVDDDDDDGGGVGGSRPLPSAQAAARGDMRVELVLRTAQEEVLLQTKRVSAAALAFALAAAARTAVPTLVRSSIDQVLSVASAVQYFVSSELLGRARPQARRAREQARAQRRMVRELRVAEREAERDRAARQKRWAGLRSAARRRVDPLARRALNAWQWAFDPNYDS